MKKYFIWIMIIGAILTISCDNMIPAAAENEPPAQNQPEQKAYLSVNLMQQVGRTVLPQDNTVLEDLSYDLSGVRNGKEQNFGEFSYSELLNLRCEIMLGTWDFTLSAKRNGYLVLSGSVSGKTIAVGNNSIAFTLSEASEGVGDAAVRIRCPRNGVASVCAVLQNLSDGEEADRQVLTLSDCSGDADKGEAVYKVSNLKKGFYRLFVRLYQNENDTTPINSQTVMVRIGAGCLSAGTMSFDTLNSYYTIIYHIGDMDLTADYILPTKYTVWDQISLPDESLFNVSNGEIVYGWYDNAALTGEQSVLIDYDSTGDREYWLDYKTIDDVFRTSVEHLAEVLARFKPLCGPYHVIITDSNPSLSSVKDLLQANPTLRINLDLSECGGLTSIGDSAFSGCISLTSVTIPNSVTSIVEYAFSDCISLTSVLIPGSVNTIGEGAFKGCSELESVSIQNGVREIGKEAFNKCSSLTSIVIPDSVRSIGAREGAMDNFSGGVFSGCSSLESITIPFVGEKKNFDRLGPAMVFGYIFGTLSYEGGVAVEQDYSLDLSSTSSIHHGKRTYYIPASLRNVTVTGSNDYYDNIAGHEIKHYTGLLYGAFSNCSGLTNITTCGVGGYEEIIDAAAFTGCTGLTKFDFIGSIQRWCRTTFKSNPLSYTHNLYINGELITDLVIPDDVTEIKDNAFRESNSLTSVTISDSVTSIGRFAFKKCNSLTSVSIGNSVSSIGNHAFEDCSRLTSITIPNSVTDIGISAFSGCRGLTSVTIPDSVMSIGDCAFAYCSSLTSLTIPDSVMSIGSSAFSDCSGLTSVTIPNSVTSIGDSAFYGCSGLTGISVDPDNTVYDSRNNCNALIETASNILLRGCKNTIIPDSVTSIGSMAFYNCSGLTSLTIPDGVERIGDRAFGNCPAIRYAVIDSAGAKALSKAGYSFRSIGANYDIKYLYSGDEISGILLVSVDKDVTTFTMPNNVTSIASNAFSGCNSLTSLTIPDSVTSIGYGSFSGCDKLTSITIPFVGLSPNATGNDAYFYRIFGSDISAIPPSLKEVIITGGTSIKEYAFQNCSNLTSITIPDSVTSIGNSAFSGCSGLTGSLRIPDSMTSIGPYAFYNCSGLTSLTIPDGVTSIGDNAFYNCPAVRYAAMDSDGAKALSKAGYSFRSIGANYDLKYLYSGDEVSGIELISVDKNVTSFTIPDNITSIASNAFIGCSSLTSITISDSVTSIGWGAFSGCSSLESITISFVGDKSHTSTDTYQCPFGYIFGTSSYDGGIATKQFHGYDLITYYIPASLKTVIITGGTSIKEYAFQDCSNLTSITIPESVTSIGNRAFIGCSGLTIIEIPNSVTSIGSGAFSNCPAIRYASLGSDAAKALSKAGYSFRPIGTNYDIQYLYSEDEIIGITLVNVDKDVTSFTIPDNVTSIGSNAFNGCIGLTNITIPDSVTDIGYKAFYNCSGLTSVTIPDSVTSIVGGAFSGCNGLESITLPFVGLSLTVTGDDAKFYRIFGSSTLDVPTSLKEVIITGGTNIGNYAFSDCSGLTSITIPDSVTDIGYKAFYNCSGLTSVTIESDADFSSTGLCFTKDNINYNVLNKSSVFISITSYSGDVVIPTTVTAGNTFSVTSIGERAFQNCSGLTSVTIPDSVTSIGGSAFYNCSSLTRVDYTGTIAGWCGISFGNEYANPLRYAHNLYINGELVTDLVIPNTVTEIKQYAFRGCSNLTSLTIPDSVTSIGIIAFFGCHSITSVTIESDADFSSTGLYFTKDNINYNVLNKSSVFISITSYSGDVVIPTTVTAGNTFSVTSIGERAFQNCNGLTSVTIPNSVTSIGKRAFEDCCNLISVTIPDSVTSIGDSAFKNCSSLKSISLPESMTNINSSIFEGCDALESICTATTFVHLGASYSGAFTIPDGITTIGQNAFRDCRELTSVVIPDSVTSIGTYAFCGCINLTSVNIPNGVTYINNFTFASCRSLTSIIIPNSVTGIDAGAFSDCRGLTSIDIPDSVDYLDSSYGTAFNGCSSLTSITIGSGLEMIGKTVFRNCNNIESISVNPNNNNFDSRNNCNAIIRTNSNELIVGCKNTVVPDGVTSIGESAFSGCSGLTSITIPNGVTSIESEAFKNCSNLTSISLPESLTNIGSYVFEGCDSLEGIYTATTFIHLNTSYSGEYTIPNGITTISDGAFRRCSGLTSVTIPDSVTSIGEEAFSYCSNLTSVTLPNNETNIGQYAFEYCSSLTSIEIPDTTRIGKCAFYYCSGLTSVTIGRVWGIQDNSFCVCNSLTTLNVKATTPIQFAFGNCTALTKIYVPTDSVDAYKVASGWSGYADKIEGKEFE